MASLRYLYAYAYYLCHRTAMREIPSHIDMKYEPYWYEYIPEENAISVIGHLRWSRLSAECSPSWRHPQTPQFHIAVIYITQSRGFGWGPQLNIYRQVFVRQIGVENASRAGRQRMNGANNSRAQQWQPIRADKCTPNRTRFK